MKCRLTHVGEQADTTTGDRGFARNAGRTPGKAAWCRPCRHRITASLIEEAEGALAGRVAAACARRRPSRRHSARRRPEVRMRFDARSPTAVQLLTQLLFSARSRVGVQSSSPRIDFHQKCLSACDDLSVKPSSVLKRLGLVSAERHVRDSAADCRRRRSRRRRRLTYSIP
jgi:hypothetical protein